MRDHSNQDAYGVSVLMAYYGCRTEEVTGIELADVDLTGKTPFFHIRANETRPSLKTNTSQRRLPLLGKALEVVREAYKAAQDTGEKTLFPRYSTGKGATSVSAVRCKVVRRYVSQDKKLVPYSARHLMMDALKNSGANETIRNEILGHTSGKVSEVYGAGYALVMLSSALQKVIAALEGK
jgi:integrase